MPAPRALARALAAGLALAAAGLAHPQEPAAPPAPSQPEAGMEPPAPPDGPDHPSQNPDDWSEDDGWATPPSEPAPPPRKPVTLLLSFGAYYTSAGLYVPLTDDPTPDAGEGGELGVYRALLPRVLRPQFLVVEASVNPMPCLGLAAREWRWGYHRAQVGDDLNLVRALTAGFDEPVAVSIFLGNVADYRVRGRDDVRGRGYLGLVVSGGPWHIRDNVAIRDPWVELELKHKGDRTTPTRRHSWSLRAGVKLHAHPDVADLAYLAVRRSRADLVDDSDLLANAGVEARLDLGFSGRPLRAELVVDRKWAVFRERAALVLGVGLRWESGQAYRGALRDPRAQGLQLLVRPNVVF